MSKVTGSKKALQFTESVIREMTRLCEAHGGVNLSQGVCDTPVPDAVASAVAEGVARGYNIYTRHDGIGELRRAIAAKLAAFNGLTVDPETEVVVSAGSTGALYASCLALLDAGDGVILFEPGAVVDAVLAAVTPRTRAIIVNTPGNPSGKVYTRAELEMIRDFAGRHDLFVFTDEIYEHILFDGRAHISPASIPGMAERTITISGFSKTFSITGWRVGYAVAQTRWAQTIGFYNDLVYVCAPAPLQYAVAQGLGKLDRSYYEGLATEYAGKRDQICDTLRRAGLTPFVPQGAYYVIADASRLPGRDSKDRAMHLLETTGVASVPGVAFFQSGAGDLYLRFCFAKNDRDLDDACDRLAKLA